MYRKLIILGLLCFIIIFCVACGSDDVLETVDDNKWENFDVSSNEMISTIVNSSCNYVDDFFQESFDINNKLYVQSKFNLEINEQVLYVDLAGNYDVNNEADSVVGFSVVKKYESYDPAMVLGMYLNREKVYVCIGETKFSFNFQSKIWSEYFPFDSKKLPSKEKISLGIIAGIKIKDDDIKAEKRLTEDNILEKRYEFYIDLEGTIKKLNTILAEEKNPEKKDMFYNLISNILGVDVEDILDENLPNSEIKINFSISESELKSLNVDVDIEKNSDNIGLFGSEDIKFNFNIDNITQEKCNKSVKLEHFEDLDDYFDYRDKILQVRTAFTDYSQPEEKLELNMTAKVFQNEESSNYFSMETLVVGEDEKTPKRGLYFYEENFYYYEMLDNEYKCLFKGSNISFTQVITDLLYNELVNKNAQIFDVLQFVSYLVANLEYSLDGMCFGVNENFYDMCFYNFYDFIEYLDDKYEENLVEDVESFNSIIERLTTSRYKVQLYWDKYFLFEMEQADIEDKFEMLNTAVPEIIFTPII